MDKFPWEETREEYTYVGRTWVRIPPKIIERVLEYNVVKSYIKDSPRQYWRKGDIVKFEDGLIEPSNWTAWFYRRTEREKYWNRKPHIPKYADNKFAIIIGRYKKTKYKWCTFNDYGVVVMMLNGSKPGHTRHYWTKKPFKIKVRYTENIKYKYLLKALPPEVIEIYNQPRNDTNEARNEMLHEIYHFYN
jgi:hypothetical protein